MKKLLLSLGAIASVAAPVAAVVACGTTPAKTPTHIDEGFNNASLIENFDIADEAPTVKTISEYSIDGTKYDVSKASGAGAFVEAWAKSLNADPVFSAFVKQAAVGGDKVTVTKTGDNIAFALDSASGSGVVAGTDAMFEAGKFENFKDKAEQIFSFNGPYKAWEKAHNFIAGETQIKVAAIKNDSVDAILYSQANSLNTTQKTSDDRVTIEGTSSYERSSGLDFDLFSYDGTKVMAQQPLAAEFNKGDKIKFIFDNSSDIASFTQRVKFIDTFIPGYKAADKLSSMSSNVSFKTIKKTLGSGYEVVGYNGDDIMFSLRATKKNVITLEFKDFLKPGYDQDGVFLGLSGFVDSNNDGVVNHDDESMTNQFIIGYGRLSSSKFGLLHEDTFIYGNVDGSEVK